MNIIYYLCLCVLLVSSSCKKNVKTTDDDTQKLDLERIEEKNSTKVAITTGVWGTVSKKEGDCMPMIDVKTTTCKQYAIEREVRVYEYTKVDDATPKSPVNGLYDQFKTRLIKTVKSDAEGFFQAELPGGKYTVVIVEEGKLYVGGWDGQGGISPVEITQNKVKANLVLNRAVY